MFGISYGQLLVLLGASTILIGPKDLPRVARSAGRLVGRGVGYLQLARGQFDNVMHKSQVSQVHKEVQDAMAQLQAIRYEIRSMSIINPGPLTRSHDIDKSTGESIPPAAVPKVFGSSMMVSTILQSEAAARAELAEDRPISGLPKVGGDTEKPDDDSGLVAVLPVSAESAGFLPKRGDTVTGSDIVLEAILEAEVARNAKLFFSQPENQIPKEQNGNLSSKQDLPKA